MRLACSLTWLLILTGVARTVVAAPPPPLRFGLLPYVSTHRLLDQYQPIKTYLEARLKRAVIVSTAPDFKTYVERACRGEYDLYHTAPHFAALAELDYGYHRLSRLSRELEGSLVIARGSGIKSVADLRGKVVFAPDPLAIITMLGEELLAEHGLHPGVEVTVRYTPSHNNAVLAVARRKAHAAIISAAVFETMPDEVRAQLTVVAHTRRVPHMMFMAGPNVSAEDAHALQRALLDFTASGAGKRFFHATGYGDMTRIDDRAMFTVAPFIPILKQRLEKPPAVIPAVNAGG